MAPKRSSVDRVGKRRVCALTCARAYHGCRKPAGECRMTRLAYGDATLDDGLGQPKYTVCGNCRHALCVDCLEQVAVVVDAHSQRVVAHDVFHALMVRAWRQTAGRCRGFELRHGGGELGPSPSGTKQRGSPTHVQPA